MNWYFYFQKKDDKKKSNLELFKEEIMVMQKEREMRHATKYGRSVMAFPPSPERDGGSRHKSFRSDVIDERALARISSVSCKCKIVLVIIM